MPRDKKIDVHHHMITPSYSKALEENGGDPSGYPTPKWSLSADDEFCESAGIGTTIFSLTAPGAGIVQGEAAAKLARDTNQYLASVRDKNPDKYGFFAALPPLTDVSAALEEINYALDELKADGVTLFTRYGEGNGYLGHAEFKPIWKALNEKHAVVFIHPTHSVDTNLVNPKLPQPIIDYPQETTRTAADLIVSDTLKDVPNCKIILSHAGGTLPYLADRLQAVGDGGLANKTREDIARDVASFYYDLALSSSKRIIDVLLKVTTPDHILFGSDFPYAPTKTIASFVEKFDNAQLGQELEYDITKGNALKLFPRLSHNFARGDRDWKI